MFAVHVSLLVEPGAEEAFLATIGDDAAGSLRDEPAARASTWRATPPIRPGSWLDERYADADTFAAHRHTRHYDGWRALAGELMRDGREVVHIGEPVGEAAVVTCARAAHMIDPEVSVRTIHMTARDRGHVQFVNGISEFAEAERQLHRHNCEESGVVIEGLATIEAGDERHTLGTGDPVRVPARFPHRFRDAGPERLHLLWTSGRADATRALAATKATFKVAEEPKQPA
jgi:putative monooxygenase